MNRRCTVLLIPIVGIAFALPELYAEPLPMFDLASLERDSDVIAVVRVTTNPIANTGVQDHGALSGEVVRSFKGSDVPANVQVRVSSADLLRSGVGNLAPGSLSVFFLRQGTDGILSITEPFYPAVPLEHFWEIEDRPSLSVRERIGRQLELQCRDTGLEGLWEPMEWAERIGYYLPSSTLWELTNSRSERVRTTALAQLVDRNDSVALEKSIDTLFASAELSTDGLARVGQAVYSAMNEVEVGDINALAGSSHTGIRNMALRMLQYRGNESSIPVLLDALDVADRAARYAVVLGLARITGQRAATVEEFAAEPDAECRRWRAWAAAFRNTEPAEANSRVPMVTQIVPNPPAPLKSTATDLSSESSSKWTWWVGGCAVLTFVAYVGSRRFTR